MIYLHKILPLIFSPLVVVVSLVIYGAIKNRKTISLLGVLLLYLASNPLISGILFRYTEENATRQDPNSLPQVNAIVVLGGILASVQAIHGRTYEWADPDRFYAGIELYKLGKSNKLIFTGGIPVWKKQSMSEGIILKKFATEMGVPESDVVVTGEAKNTEQEAIALANLLDKKKTSILLVTSAYHMPRARMIFQHAGFKVHEYPVDFRDASGTITPLSFIPSTTALSMTDITIREQIGRLYYWLKYTVSKE